MDLGEATQLLASKRVEDRIRAVQALGRGTSGAVQCLLVRALGDRSHYVAAMAAERLKDAKEPETLLAMLQRFAACMEAGPKRDPGCHIRARLAIAFGRAGYAPAVEALRAGLRTVQIEQVGTDRVDTGAHLRANSALALGQLRPQGVVRDLALLLFAGAEPANAAARALALTCLVEAATPLVLRLAHPDGATVDVLQESMQALVALEDPQTLEFLAPYLEHRDPQLAAFAAVTLAQTHLPGAAPLIRDAAERLQGDAQRAAALALVTLRVPEGRAALDELASHPREGTRLAAVEALRQAADPDALKALRRVAEEDPSPRVRAVAKEATEG